MEAIAAIPPAALAFVAVLAGLRVRWAGGGLLSMPETPQPRHPQGSGGSRSWWAAVKKLR